MKKQERKLTNAELEIMHVVWELDGGTVRQVH
jgi:predicted transcriptional regulator